MLKPALFLTLISAGAILASACEPDGGKTAPVGKPSALGGDEASAEESSETSTDASGDTGSEIDYDVAPGDRERLPFRVSWTSDGEDTGATDVLEFSVANTTDSVHEVSVSVVASCPFGQAELSLGEILIGPEEVVGYSVHADDLPIRSTVFLTRLSVKLQRTINMIDHPAQIATTYAGPLYRHEAGFASVRPFSDANFKEELAGVVVPSPEASSPTSLAELADATLGEVSDGEGGWSALRRSSRPGMVMYDDDGNVAGVVTRVSVGVDEGDDGEAIIAPEPEETEVGDE